MERAEGGPGAPAPVTRARGDPPANPPRAPAPETSEGARRKAFKARVAVLKRDFMARKLERMATEVRAAHALIPDLVAGVESGIRRRPSAPFNASAQGDPSGDDHGSGPAGEGKNEGEDGVAAGSVSDAGNEDGRRDPWQLPLNKVVRVKMRGGGKGGGWVRVQYRANRIPRCNTIPPYSAWLYITQNASNQDNDKRMFYTDETGESVPASDEEGQSWASWMWNGYDSDWRVFCVEMMVEEALEGGGDKGAVVGLLADKFKVEAEIVDARAKEVERRRAPKPDPEDLSVEETLHKVKGFCRRCRKFECVLHGREPIEPHLKPPPLRLEPSEACGPNCFMVRSRKRRGGKDERDVGGGAGKRARHSSASPTAARGGMAVRCQPARTRSPQSPSAGSPLSQRTPRQSPLSQRTTGSKVRLTGSPQARSTRRHPFRTSPSGADDSHPPSAAKMDGSGSARLPKGPGKKGSRQGGFTTWELSLVSKGLEMFGAKACFIAMLLDTKSCYEVHLLLKRNPNLLANVAGLNKARRNKLKGKQTAVQKRFHHNEAELWHQYTPCTCVGPCNSTCPCIKSGNFCERFCACFRNCQNQFRGCNCKSLCNSLRCPCLAAGRECDPDICKGCSRTILPNCPSHLWCHNMCLRLGRHRRIAMGLSTVAGWGAFLMEPAAKDDFLGEYTGDLISDQEAERRGTVYDRQDKSYLFNLTKEGVLDANRRGNKLRFANHSLNPNCFVKYMLVDGDHHVGIFAGTDIKAGEELFYDYGTAWSSKWYDPDDSSN